MLKLVVGKIGEKDNVMQSPVVQSPSIPVRWCVDEETRKVLAGKGVINPHVLLVTIYDSMEKDRQLVPLENVMTYVQFQSPGPNTIAATIVWAEDGNKNTLWKKFLKKEDGAFETDLVYPSSGNFVGEELENSCGEDSVEVFVPEGLFAQKPFDWNYVNYGFSREPKDQCEFRKRRIYSYTLKPFFEAFKFVSLWVIGFLGVLIMLSIGVRPSRINWRILFFHPWVSLKLYAVWDNFYLKHRYPREAWYYLQKHWKTTKYETLVLFTPWVSLPAVWIILYVFFLIMANSHQVELPAGGKTTEFASWEKARFLVPFYATLILWATVNIVCFFIDLFRIVFFKLDDYISSKKPAWEKERKERIAKEGEEFASKYFSKEFEPVFCEQGDLQADITALPEAKRTIFLRFLDLKSRVCRPFAA